VNTFAVLATGPSMSQDLADKVRGRCHVIAVSDAFRLAPWADALVSQDRAWWKRYPEALEFSGRKFSTNEVAGVERILQGIVKNGTNSGLLGMEVAKLMGAARILLLGFDLRGTHYFGPHPSGLKNTTPERFKVMLRQFAKWPRNGVEVLNCTGVSDLKCFPMARLEDVL